MDDDLEERVYHRRMKMPLEQIGWEGIKIKNLHFLKGELV